jgi:peptidoglycan/xylan/chitin deacetylase (PgdA/CDA1 family)
LRPAYLTISADDGHPADMRLAELLDRHGLTATFYLMKAPANTPLLGRGEICELAERFEIGGHGIDHLPLDRLPPTAAERNIAGCKAWLEDIIGIPVRSFAYPFGRFNRRLAQAVASAGFRGARTMRSNHHHMPRWPYAVGISTHTAPDSIFKQLQRAIWHRNVTGMLNFALRYGFTHYWPTHFARSLDIVEREGGVAHLCVHTWLIDRHDQWSALERTLEACAARRALRPITNGELFALVADRSAGISP